MRNAERLGDAFGLPRDRASHLRAIRSMGRTPAICHTLRPWTCGYLRNGRVRSPLRAVACVTCPMPNAKPY